MSDDHSPSLVPERRRFRRHGADVLPGLKASILAGPNVDVIDVSHGGVLIESDVRMTPGVGICLNMTVDDQKVMVGGRITRVDAVLVKGTIRYRAGVALDEELAIPEPPADSVAGPDATSADADRPALPSDWPLAAAVDAGEADRLRTELEQVRRDREVQEHVLDRLREAVLSGETLRKEVTERHAAEQELWLQEQQGLQERVLVAEAQVVELTQQVAAAREEERRFAQERTRLETMVREYEQQLAEVRATHEALARSVDGRAETHERERAEWDARQATLTAQLQTTEGWCAEQQELLYRVRQQMSTVFGLLYGAQPTQALIDAAARAALERAAVATGDGGPGEASGEAVAATEAAA